MNTKKQVLPYVGTGQEEKKNRIQQKTMKSLASNNQKGTAFFFFKSHTKTE